jgi:hypothetical protein
MPGPGRRQTLGRRVVVITPNNPSRGEVSFSTPVQSEDDDIEMEMAMEIQDETLEGEPRLSLQRFLSMTSISFLRGPMNDNGASEYRLQWTQGRANAWGRSRDKSNRLYHSQSMHCSYFFLGVCAATLRAIPLLHLRLVY